MKIDEQGVLHVPLAMFTTLAVLTGLGLWGLLHHWKYLTRTQLRLDQCTGETALELKTKLTEISSANDRIKELRIAEAATTLSPEASAGLRALVEAEALRQEELRASWIVRQGTWSLRSGCGSPGDQTAPLPGLSWHRVVPDTLGEKPLRLEELPSSFHFELKHSPRGSAAEVFRGGSHESNWYARWIAPRELFRPSIY
jgi:hypothetical protein